MKNITIQKIEGRFEALFPFCMETKDWLKSLRYANEKFSFDFDKKVWWTSCEGLAEYAIKLQNNDYKETVSEPKKPVLAGEIKLPEGVTPYDYQKEGILFCSSADSALLADDMGLGKSLQSIGVANITNPEKVLIICPNSLRLNWRNEWKKFSIQQLEIQIIHDVKEQITGGVVVLNYEKICKMKSKLQPIEWDLLIVDEAHRLKNKDAKTTQAILGKTGKKEKIEPIKAKRKLFLTGTPILNRPNEIFTLCQACDPTGLGADWWKFVNRYCGAKQGRFGLDISGATNLSELKENISRFTIRRTKDEVLQQLPKKREQVLLLEPDENQLFALEAERLALSEKVDWMDLNLDDPKISLAINQIAKFRKETALSKLPTCFEIFEDDLENGKLVVMAHHREVVEAIFNKFERSHGAVMIHGGVDMEERQKAVDRFQKDPSCLLFVGSILAAGVGLTLTAASQMNFVESDWRPGMMQQAADRIHRIGQENSVLIKHIVLDGSIDAWMVNKLIEKQKIIKRVF